MVIGVTDTHGSEHKFQKYLDWLNRGMKNGKTVTLSHTLNNADAIRSCDAIVLTGGNDVDPELYNGPRNHKKITDVNRKRDDFELEIMDRALDKNLPVLCICRGLQLANVFFGGSLLPDLEENGCRSHRSENDQMECRHAIVVEQNSMLFEITNTHTGIVNSSHHQAAMVLGKGLRAVAHSDDGVIEAIELVNKSISPFFLAVQWHPERMSDVQNPFSRNLLQKFLHSAEVMTK